MKQVRDGLSHEQIVALLFMIASVAEAVVEASRASHPQSRVDGCNASCFSWNVLCFWFYSWVEGSVLRNSFAMVVSLPCKLTILKSTSF
ncbi:hypothetical protein GOP47_0012842 [Adiantum capillus-veneris]|uniref:Secreted protein n=1 Tax=Adiantum capillus-veneris TaxID=13818 RepID=A0A9D4US15_ADICA|nr:hypothetical protein GOP47_0012842 [Adiantum capillus-veneris]